MAARLRRVLIAGLLCSLAAPGLALADGDPASDTLLGQNVFYPYAPTAPSAQRTLNAETAAAKQAGFPIKVALIQAPTDLGVIPSLFGKPAQYARFLDQEISFRTKQPLLVVMYNGYGTQGLSDPATEAVGALHPPAGKSSTALADAASAAVVKLASASGHPIKGASGGSSRGGDSWTTPALIGLVAAAVVVGGALVVLRRREPVGPTR